MVWHAEMRRRLLIYLSHLESLKLSSSSKVPSSLTLDHLRRVNNDSVRSRMLFNWASLIVQNLRNPTSLYLYDVRVQLSHPAYLLIFSLVVTWLGWRCWRFTITPLLYPNEIKELPYWIPCKSFRNPFFFFFLAAPSSCFITFCASPVLPYQRPELTASFCSFRWETNFLRCISLQSVRLTSPIVGHAGSFFKDSHGTISHGRYTPIFVSFIVDSFVNLIIHSNPSARGL